MSRFVKISTIGAKKISFDTGESLNGIAKTLKQHWQEEFDQVAWDNPDMIILPEMCDTPFGIAAATQKEFHSEFGDEMLDFFKTCSVKYHTNIVYPSLAAFGDNRFGNCARVIDRDARIIGIYQKNHPTLSETEHYNIAPGSDAPIIKCDFGRLGCILCFDLNYDDLRLKYAASGPDLLIFASLYHGGLMQNYWAYSCRTHFASAVAGLQSMVISPVGEVIASSTNYFDYATAVINLDCMVIHLDCHWEKLKAMKMRYGPKVKVTDPGYLGAVLIACETDEFNIHDIKKEFQFELLNDYLIRSAGKELK